MQLVVDDNNLGTPESEWNSSSVLRKIEPLGPITARRIVLIAPHPDDEVFGAAGLVQQCLSQGIAVEVLAVTDGEASHPHAEAEHVGSLAERRVEESAEALGRLGWETPLVRRLGVRDGAVRERAVELHAALMTTLRPGDWCVAPWPRDGHPDHDACGDVARSASRDLGIRSLHYLVWAWHWANPHGPDIPWSACRRVDLSRRERARKRWATGAFSSQTQPLGNRPGEEAVLPAPIMRRFWRPFEVFVEGDGA